MLLVMVPGSCTVSTVPWSTLHHYHISLHSPHTKQPERQGNTLITSPAGSLCTLHYVGAVLQLPLAAAPHQSQPPATRSDGRELVQDRTLKSIISTHSCGHANYDID